MANRLRRIFFPSVFHLKILGSILLMLIAGFTVQQTRPESDASARQKTLGALQDALQDSLQDSLQEGVSNYQLNLDEEGRALGGYDAVSYFEQGTAKIGTPVFQILWKGAKWHFESEENQQKFLNNPEEFAPSNGGYCTFGIVLRQKLDGDPKIWLIDQNRLYVFLNAEVKQKFLLDRAANLATVAQNWVEIADAAPEILN